MSLTATDIIEPICPGEVLMEDFIEGFEITQNKPAVSISVPPWQINEIQCHEPCIDRLTSGARVH
jgi:plasmid maintenance system antidote protein VapI